jgi:hypothetical protein
VGRKPERLTIALGENTLGRNMIPVSAVAIRKLLPTQVAERKIFGRREGPFALAMTPWEFRSERGVISRGLFFSPSALRVTGDPPFDP